MSPSPLWLSIEPRLGFTQLALCGPAAGTQLRARLSPTPAMPGALGFVVELDPATQWEEPTADSGRRVFSKQW